VAKKETSNYLFETEAAKLVARRRASATNAIMRSLSVTRLLPAKANRGSLDRNEMNDSVKLIIRLGKEKI
jgi:hypothetical protein